MTELFRQAHLDEMRPWDDRTGLLEVIAILPETKDVRTFFFKSPEATWFRYEPGQFITLELPVGERPIYRTYTLSSSPSRPLVLSVTVKAQMGSIGTRWMFDNLKVGDRLRAIGPAGLFSCTFHPADKYLFVSAGTGITPMMSMTRWFFDSGTCSDITFVNCARRPSELIFREELERIAARLPDFRLAWVVSEPDPYQAWTGFRGRLNHLMLELIAGDYFEREIFCCGPAGFMQTVRDALNLAGFDMSRYHEESFAAPVTDPDEVVEPDDVIPDETKTARVVFRDSGVEAKCRETDTLLEVARAAGLVIPSGCQFGVCGTCKVKAAGETHMVHNGGIRDEEIDEGYVLACCTKPLGVVEVEA